MGLSGLFRSVKRHRWLAIGIFVLSQLVTAAFWFVLPHQYKSTAMVLIPGWISPGRTVQDDPRNNVLAGRIALLQSRLVTDRVLHRLGLNTAEPLKEQWERVKEPRPAFEDWLANVISGGLLPEVNPKSFILSVSYISTNPDFASGLANAYAAELVDVVSAINQRSDQSAGSASERGAKDVLKKMKETQERILALGRQNGTTQESFLDPQVKGFYSLSRLATINLKASLEQDAVVDALAGMNDYGSLLDDEFLKDRRQVLASLVALQASNLETKGASHPDSVKIKAVIEGVQRQITAHELQRSRAVTAGSQIQRRSSQGMEQDDAQARQKLLASAGNRLEYDRAVQDVEALGEQFVEFSKDSAVIELNNDAPKADMFVIQAAASPVNPWFPKLSYVLPISLGLGLICMLFACRIAGARHPAIASEQDLSKIVGAAAIGRLTVNGQKS